MDGDLDDRSRRAFLVAMTGVSVAGCLDGSRAPIQETTSTERTETPDPTQDSESTATEEIHADYETTTVEAQTPDGTVLASVTAAIADTWDLRYTGLSDTDHLPPDRGMLFVFDEVGHHTFVMREMDFGIDIVYADDEGTITEIHHASAPGPDEDGEDQEYPGRGQYVLEVVKGWTIDHDVEVGDVLVFAL